MALHRASDVGGWPRLGEARHSPKGSSMGTLVARLSRATRAAFTALVGMRGAIAVGVLGGLLSPAVAHGDAVTQWNVNASNAIFARRTDRTRLDAELRDGPRRRLRRRQRDRRRLRAVPRPARRERGASKDAAVATAAYRVLVAVVPPAQTAALATLAGAVRRSARRGARRAGEGRRDRRRGGRRRRDARRARRRRAQPDAPRSRSCSARPPASGACRRRSPRRSPRRGSATSRRSSSRAPSCCAPTARTRSRAPRTPRTSTRSSRSAR